MPARQRNPANRCPSSRARPACPSLPAGNWRRPAPRVRTTRKVTTHEPTSFLSLRPSSPASRSFVLAPLRALQLDPGSSRRARQPRGQPPTAPRSTAQRPPLRGDSLDKTSGFTDAVLLRIGPLSSARGRERPAGPRTSEGTARVCYPMRERATILRFEHPRTDRAEFRRTSA